MWRQIIVVGLLALVAVALGAAIARQGGDRAAVSAAVDDGPRIVSLSPGITRTLVDLDLGRHVVGRTPWCRSFDDVPVVGDLSELDYECLVRVGPTHVLVQPSDAGVEPGLVALAEKQSWTLVAWSPLDDRTDIEGLIRDLPGALFAPDDERAADVSERAQSLRDRFGHAFRPRERDTPVPGALLLVDGERPLAFGAETYLGDVLEAVGLTNLAPCEGWCELSLEDLVRIDPPLIVLVDDRAADGPSGWSPRLASLPLTAIREERVVLLRHPDALVPSSALIEVAEQLREILAGIEGGGA